MSWRRVGAIFRKELREYRRNGFIIGTMAVLPLVFLVQPLVAVLGLGKAASASLRHEHVLLYMLIIPALVPAMVAGYSVVGERQQATLEPVLTTPVRRSEFLLGKALATFAPSIVIAYAVFLLYLLLVELFAEPSVASAFIRPPDLIAQLFFTPLLAALSIWIGMTISTRSQDARVAQQLGLLASLPAAVVTTLIALNVIQATLSLAVAGALALVVLDALGWWVTSAAFDRERLITGSR